MSKAIVKTLHPNAKAVYLEREGYWVIMDGDNLIGGYGNGSNTPQGAWHYASAYLRGEDYDKWSEASRTPAPSAAR